MVTGDISRIAHMGHVNAPIVPGTLGVVATGLTARGIPHGSGGVQAAVESLACGQGLKGKRRIEIGLAPGTGRCYHSLPAGKAIREDQDR